MAKGLDYIINLKDGDFGGADHAKSAIGGIDNAVAETEHGLGSLKGVIGEVGAALAGAFAVEKVIDFGKESLSVYRSTAAAEAQITAGIKSTADASGLSLDDLREKAEELEHVTLFTQAQTEQAQAIELSFTNIRGAIFNEAIPAIEDLATRMGGDGPADLKGASVQVGKAMQDPITGIIALHRVGVEFTDAQKEMIATDVKHGEVQKAQSIILQELQTEFGGSAEAARGAMGAVGDLDEETEQLKKGFGSLINDGLNAVVPALVSSMNWITANKDVLEDIGTVLAFGAGAWAIYETAVLGAGAATAITNTVMGISNTISVIAAEYATAQAEGYGILTSAQWALNVAMDANPIGLIITGIGVLIGLVYEAYEHSETFRAVLAGIGEVAKELVPIFKGLGEVILGALTFDGDMIKKGFTDSVNGVMDIVNHGGISGAFERGSATSIYESRKAEAEHKKKEEDAKKGTASDLVHHGNASNSPYSISTGGKGHKGSSSAGESLAGGRSVRNVQVTIGKLVERLEVHTTNLQGVGGAEIKRMLTELLVESVHDSELALGSQ